MSPVARENHGGFHEEGLLRDDARCGPGPGPGRLRDAAGDAAPRAEIRALDSDGALIASTSGRTVVLLGVPGAVVVDTPDALLVTTPEHAQDVKGVVDALRTAGREDLL